jgi:peptidoglycan/LPS O-acetylase OafA/YrhL
MAVPLTLESRVPNAAADPRTNNFDALRLAAASSVLFSHSFLIAEGSEAREPFAWLTGNQCILGLVGVFAFFIISGYLVTESYCRTPAPGRFALKRGLRIYPALAVNAIVCAILLGPIVTTLPLSAYFADRGVGRFVAHVLMLDPGPLQLPGVLFADNSVGLLINGSLWTLRYEVMMYVMVLLLGIGRLLRLETALALTALGVAAVYCEASLKPFGDFGEMAWLLGFFASGMAMYFLRDRLPFGWPYALLAVLGLVIFTWAGKFIMLFPLAGAYLAIWFARRYNPALGYARHVGDLSYGVYIYGWPAAQLVMYLSGGRANWWQILIGSLALSLALAWLSWHGVEKWALRWGRSRRAAVPRQQVAAADA